MSGSVTFDLALCNPLSNENAYVGFGYLWSHAVILCPMKMLMSGSVTFDLARCDPLSNENAYVGFGYVCSCNLCPMKMLMSGSVTFGLSETTVLLSVRTSYDSLRVNFAPG